MTARGVQAFRRYTNLAATIHLLQQKCITLLNPATWDDRNDAYFMAEYKRYKQAQTVLALCFAARTETYHHWRVFSHGSDGVCIDFNQARLLRAFAQDSRVKMGAVEYRNLHEVKDLKSVDLERLPFMKRHAYKDECEFRVMYVDEKEGHEFKSYPIGIDCIRRISLSPWMSRALEDSVRRTLRSIEGCEKLMIGKTTLIDNEMWKRVTSRVRQNRPVRTIEKRTARK